MCFVARAIRRLVRVPVVQQIFEVLEESFVWYDKPVYNVARVAMVIPDMCQGRLLFHQESDVPQRAEFHVRDDILPTLKSGLMSETLSEFCCVATYNWTISWFSVVAEVPSRNFIWYEGPALVEPEKNLHFFWNFDKLVDEGRHCHPVEWISFLVRSSGIVCRQSSLRRW